MPLKSQLVSGRVQVGCPWVIGIFVVAWGWGAGRGQGASSGVLMSLRIRCVDIDLLINFASRAFCTTNMRREQWSIEPRAKMIE